MARNKLSDINDHLVAQLERLTDEELSPENLKAEIHRSKAIADITKRIVEVKRLELDAITLAVEKLPANYQLPATFGEIKKLNG